MSGEREFTQFRKRLIKIYKNSVNKRDGKHAYYHILVCFILELYAGFRDGELNFRRIPFALTCALLLGCELIIEMFAETPRRARLMLERKYE